VRKRTDRVRPAHRASAGENTDCTRRHDTIRPSRTMPCNTTSTPYDAERMRPQPAVRDHAAARHIAITDRVRIGVVIPRLPQQQHRRRARRRRPTIDRTPQAPVRAPHRGEPRATTAPPRSPPGSHPARNTVWCFDARDHRREQLVFDPAHGTFVSFGTYAASASRGACSNAAIARDEGAAAIPRTDPSPRPNAAARDEHERRPSRAMESTPRIPS
jgi:hypothetical protein